MEKSCDVPVDCVSVTYSPSLTNCGTGEMTYRSHFNYPTKTFCLIPSNASIRGGISLKAAEGAAVFCSSVNDSHVCHAK